VGANEVGEGEDAEDDNAGTEESERCASAALWLRRKRFWKATMSLISWMRVTAS
jgi:hypothetical protein